MEMLGVGELRAMMIHVSEKIIENESLLTQIDLQTGDGDHGTCMARGFRAVGELLAGKDFFLCAREIFKEIGMALIDHMGGTSGVVFGTLFISGALGLPDAGGLTLGQFADMLARSLDAIMKRGRAAPGDKTMVDALSPAVESLLESAKNGVDPPLALGRAAEWAQAGVEGTKSMVAKAGRARAYGERSLGHQDAGATSVYIMLSAMSEYMDTRAGD